MSIRENGFREKIDSGKWFSGKSRFGKISFRENVFSGKSRFGKIAIREKKFGKMVFGKMAFGKMTHYQKKTIYDIVLIY